MTAPETAEDVRSVRQTQCCIVGAGPAGVMLALLLARRGVETVLLESHLDFERDFRGDTIHPSTLEILDQLGLADRLLQLPHGKMVTMTLNTPQGPVQVASLQRLRTRFPFVMMLPQSQFLAFVVGEARRYPNLQIVMGANVQQLLEENGVVRGVRYHDLDRNWHEVRAVLTVATDGRFSRLRHLAGLEPIKTAPPMDVVWFRLPRHPGDPHDQGALFVGGGRFAILLDRGHEFQAGYVIPKGGYQRLRKAGIQELREGMVQLIPWLRDRIELIHDWNQVSLLSVESSRLRRWYRPGLLLLGDAAHVMSPVGGVGINAAIQDAVEAANVLAEPLRAGRVRLADLAEVQRRREWAVRIVQALQGFLQRNLVREALADDRPFRLPLLPRLLFRLPLLRDLPGRLIGFGPKRVRVHGRPANP